jgi:hypothetical protein
MHMHTPGPWTFAKNVAYQPIVESENPSDNGRFVICQTFGTHKHPNARLIAAAPDLLEALTALLSYTRACEDMLNVRPSATTHPTIKAAHAAIAKATNTIEIEEEV